MRSKNAIRKNYFSKPKSRGKVWGVNVLWDFFSIPKYIALLDRLKKLKNVKIQKMYEGEKVWGEKGYECQIDLKTSKTIVRDAN